MRSSVILSLASLSSAHFLVNGPPSAGFDDSKEGTAPCGGFTPNLDKATDFHIDGDAISLKLTHPQGKWLLRVTEDPTAQSGWEQIHPIVEQSGLGDFCVPQVTVPEKYAGKKGVIGVVSDAVDGLLYQCIPANFVKGTNSPPPSYCKNSTIQVSFTDDADLSALVGPGASSGSNATSGSSSPSATRTSAPSASSTHNAATSLQGALSLLTMALMGVLV